MAQLTRTEFAEEIITRVTDDEDSISAQDLRAMLTHLMDSASWKNDTTTAEDISSFTAALDQGLNQ